MNKVLLCFAFASIHFTSSAQKVYFIYLQSEPQQAFFVKMNKQIYSSTATGYLILSKLRDSSYSFTVGFPDGKWPEQNFSVTVNKKDHGYLLKNFGEKGWGLFDMETLAVQMSVGGTAKLDTPTVTGNKDVSVFTDVLSKAADDPSLKEKPVQPKTEEKKTDTVVHVITKKEEQKTAAKDTVVNKPVETNPTQLVVKKEEVKEPVKDTLVAKPREIAEQPVTKKEEPKTEIKEQPTVQPEEKKITTTDEYKRSVVTRRSESSTTEGFGLVFTDDSGGGNIDTIRLVIPNPRPVVVPVKEEPKEEKKFLDVTAVDTVKKIEVKSAAEEKPKEEKKLPETVPVDTIRKMEVKPVVGEKPKEEKKLPDIVPADTVKTSEVKPAVEEKKGVTATNRNKCPGMADESDFFKLRKKMAAEEGDDNMITEARKYMKTKCFTVLQIKNLSSLFLNDEGKYKFFDMAYAFVSDPDNFPQLQSELKDNYYINRFKAMLR